MESLLNGLYSVSAFILIISIIVFVHEFGHYYVARIAGVKIEAFSIGFGPSIFSWKDKNQTSWKICILPLGGYVKMFGDHNAASTPDQDKINSLSIAEKKIAFHTQPLKWRMAIVAAGPIANYLLAIVILSFFFSYFGTAHTIPLIKQVQENSAAQKAGILSNDLIIEIDGEKIEKFTDVQRITSMNQGESLEILIDRSGEMVKVTIYPEMEMRKDYFGNDVKLSKLGLVSGEVSVQKVPYYKAPWLAIKETYIISTSTLQAIGQIITGKRGVEELGGPIKIAKYSGQSAKKGFTTVLWFMAILSINLGLVNLFPIPMLDGGHLFYYVIEGIMGRPLPHQMQKIGFQVGLFLLVMLLIFSTFNDIRNLNLF